MGDAATDAHAGRRTGAGAATSAKGWSGLQLAVLAFIGFCGVFTDGRPDLPRWLQLLAASLSLLALALACAAVYLVASVAWPLSTSAPDDPDDPSNAPQRRHLRRLRRGASLTFVAVATMALATSANWWPVGDEGRPASGGDDVAAPSATAPSLVAAVDGDGNRWCGRLVESDRGAVLIATDRGSIELALRGLVALSPVERC